MRIANHGATRYRLWARMRLVTAQEYLQRDEGASTRNGRERGGVSGRARGAEATEAEGAARRAREAEAAEAAEGARREACAPRRTRGGAIC